jgi:hypothetical protein
MTGNEDGFNSALDKLRDELVAAATEGFDLEAGLAEIRSRRQARVYADDLAVQLEVRPQLRNVADRDNEHC